LAHKKESSNSNMQQVNLQVDPEFEALIPAPESDAELQTAIERSCGCRDVDAIIVWGNTIIDGHRRYAICKRLQLPYDVIHMTFANREEAKRYMWQRQIARRNLSDDQLAIAIAKCDGDYPVRITDRMRTIAQEMVASNAPQCAQVVSGKWSLPLAYGSWLHATGRAKPRAQHPKTVPAPPPTPEADPRAQHPKTVPAPPPTPEADPLDTALTKTAAQRAAAADRKLLKAAKDRITSLQARVDMLSAPLPRPAPVGPRVLGTAQRQAWGLSVLSDVHAGATVVPTASVCWNSYDPEICRHRLDRYFESIVWLIKDERSFAVIGHCIAVLGDLIDGHLHDDQTETSEAPLVTIDWLEPYLLGRLAHLADELGPDRELRVLWVPGNHGRDTLKPRAATYCEHSHEWALGQRVARAFADHPTIRVHAPKARDVYTSVFGRVLHGTHGDTVNYAGGVGGITIPLRKAYAMWQLNQPSYLHLTGHFHSQLDLGDGLANGSVVGYNDFARKINARPEEPKQTFCLIDSKYGKTKVSPTWLHEPTEREREALATAAKRLEAGALC
jgi:hypothetical protein